LPGPSAPGGKEPEMATEKQQKFYDDVKAGHRAEVVDAVLRTISEADAGGLDWSRSWDIEALRPQNPVTGTRYRGINRLYLARVAARESYSDPRWMTFNQAKACGCSVRKGSRGAYVEKWGLRTATRKPTDEQKEKIERGLMSERDLRFSYVALQGVYRVFNGECIEGLEPYAPAAAGPSEIYGICDGLVRTTGADVREVASERAYYSPGSDRVVVPLRGTFDTPESFGSTLLHELGHWSGHASRLDRDLCNPFGSEEYAVEELRAELASVMMQSELGFASFGRCAEDEFRNACAYLRSWASHAPDEDVERAILAAVGDASEICDYLVGPYLGALGEQAGGEAA